MLGSLPGILGTRVWVRWAEQHAADPAKAMERVSGFQQRARMVLWMTRIDAARFPWRVPRHSSVAQWQSIRLLTGGL